MKKRLFAIALVMFLFPIALLLTACGGGQVKTGVGYSFKECTIEWVGEEKEALLEAYGMTEEELVQSLGYAEAYAEVVSVFNDDGTVVATMGEESMTSWYSISGDTLTIYTDEAKTQQDSVMKIVGETLVIEKTFPSKESKIKVIFATQE